MANPLYYNLVRMYTETMGDSDVTLTTAVAGCKTFAEAGVSDSEEVTYGIITYDLTTHRPTKSEVGLGKYISSGTVFKRTTVENSTDSDNGNIDLTGLSEIYICATSAYYNTGFINKNRFASYYGSGDYDSASDSDTGISLTINAELKDQGDIGSVSANKVKIADSGWYYVSANVFMQSNAQSADLAGRIEFQITQNGSDIYEINKGFSSDEGVRFDNILIGPYFFQIADSDEFGITIDDHIVPALQLAVLDFTFLKLGEI